WSIFSGNTAYFEPSAAPFMVDYIVDDLEAMLDRLAKEGVRIDPKLDLRSRRQQNRTVAAAQSKPIIVQAATKCSIALSQYGMSARTKAVPDYEKTDPTAAGRGSGASGLSARMDRLRYLRAYLMQRTTAKAKSATVKPATASAR